MIAKIAMVTLILTARSATTHTDCYKQSKDALYLKAAPKGTTQIPS